ncbi:MAG: helicase-associated domain-containing protein [Ardenticatenales bacterium]
MSEPVDLATLLAGYRALTLTAIGAANGWFKHGLPKAAMVKRLTAELRSAAHVRAAVAGLDPAAREVLTLLQHLGGASDAENLWSPLIDDGTVGPLARIGRSFSGYRPGDPESVGKEFQDVMARLEVVGLVLGRGSLAAGSTVSDFGLSETYCIPAEVVGYLPPPLSLMPARPPTFARESPADAGLFGRQLYLMWSYLWRHKPRLLNTGWVSKRDLTALAAQMDPAPSLQGVTREDGVPLIHFQRRLLQALDVIDWPDFDACRTDEAAARALWSLPLGARADRWLAAWRSMGGWNELAQLPGVRWSPGPGESRDIAPAALRSARDRIARTIVDLGGGGQWVGVRAVAHQLRRTARDFLLPAEKKRRSSWGYYDYSYQNTPNHRYSRWSNAHGWSFDPISSDSEGWSKVETEVVRQVAQALHWLGLCDAGLNEEGRLVALRLTEFGRRALTAAPASASRQAGDVGKDAVDADPTAGARVVVQPNFHVLAIGPVPEATLMRIERFADRVGTDRVLEYVVTRASVYRAQMDGRSGASIVAALAEMSGAVVPQNVARSIEDWQRLHDQIVIHRRVSLVQAADPALMASLLAADDPGATPPLVAAAGSDTLARVADAAGAAERFGQLGVSPAGRHDPSAAGSIEVAEDGTVRPRHKVPGLFLLGRLQRLADWDPAAGVWRLTAAAAQRAQREHGLDALGQIEEWRALSAGPPPGWLDRRLKAWCGHYPAAKLHRAALIEMPNPESLADLLADPRAASIARRFKPAGPLVEVDEGDIQAWIALLAEFGIELRTVKRSPGRAKG